MEWNLATAIGSRTPRSPLLELPAELRDAIFEFALVSEKAVVTFRLDSYQRGSLQEAVQPALTRVSQQVRHEALSIWYGCNTFVLHTESVKGNDALKWLIDNELHLTKLRRLSLWVRHVSLTHDRSSHGALGIYICRHVNDEVWKVMDSWD